MKKETKKVILFFVACISNIVLFNYIFKWRRIISYREYEKSEKYYKEKIADVRINNMHFTFKQVRGVEDVETCYEKTYHLLQEITIAEHQEYKDKLRNYAHLKLWINDFTDNETDLKKRSLGERCYLDANGNICGAAFSYSYRYKTINENLDDANIRVYITNEKLMNDGMPDVSMQKDKICNIYDYNRFDLVKYNRIFNSSKIVNGMELYQGNVCTAYFDGMKYYYFCDFIGGDSAEIANKINNYVETGQFLFQNAVNACYSGCFKPLIPRYDTAIDTNLYSFKQLLPADIFLPAAVNYYPNRLAIFCISSFFVFGSTCV